MRMHVPTNRHKDTPELTREAHYTPSWCVDALFLDPVVGPTLPRAGLWVDAGAGNGAITAAAMKHRPEFEWLCVEPHDRPRWQELSGAWWRREVWTSGAQPFLHSVELKQRVSHAVAVISNPPFSLAAAFVLAAFEACPDATVIMLQRRGWIDESRHELFARYEPDERVIPRRIKFLRPDGTEEPAAFPGLCSWYIWPAGDRERREGRRSMLQMPSGQGMLL